MPVFTSRVPGPLKVGDRVLVAGKIKDNARKFSVNLCAEEGDEPRDVVLHFDVRFHRDNIISLSRKNGTWIGSGSYDTNCNLFVRGTYFRIVFELKDASVITIYCQNKFHSNFLPKIPLSAARFLVVWADVERVTQLDYHMGQFGGVRENICLPHGPPPPPQPQAPGGPPNLEASRSNPRNRPPMCANELPRLQRSRSASSEDELRRRDTDATLTERADSRSEVSQRADSTGASSVSRIDFRKKGSFYTKARAPFQNVCNFMTKQRRSKRRF